MRTRRPDFRTRALPAKPKQGWAPPAYVTLALGLWGAMAPFLTFALGQKAEAKKNRPYVVLAMDAGPPSIRGNNLQLVLPIVNRGISPAYDVTASYQVNVAQNSEVNTDIIPFTNATKKSVGPLQILVGPDAGHLVLEFPLSYTAPQGVDSPWPYVLSSGAVAVRFRVLLTYRDGLGHEHETGICVATYGPDSHPVTCSTGWERTT